MSDSWSSDDQDVEPLETTSVLQSAEAASPEDSTSYGKPLRVPSPSASSKLSASSVRTNTANVTKIVSPLAPAAVRDQEARQPPPTVVIKDVSPVQHSRRGNLAVDAAAADVSPKYRASAKAAQQPSSSSDWDSSDADDDKHMAAALKKKFDRAGIPSAAAFAASHSHSRVSATFLAPATAAAMIHAQSAAPDDLSTPASASPSIVPGPAPATIPAAAARVLKRSMADTEVTSTSAFDRMSVVQSGSSLSSSSAMHQNPALKAFGVSEDGESSRSSGSGSSTSDSDDAGSPATAVSAAPSDTVTAIVLSPPLQPAQFVRRAMGGGGGEALLSSQRKPSLSAPGSSPRLDPSLEPREVRVKSDENGMENMNGFIINSDGSSSDDDVVAVMQAAAHMRSKLQETTQSKQAATATPLQNQHPKQPPGSSQAASRPPPLVGAFISRQSSAADEHEQQATKHVMRTPPQSVAAAVEGAAVTTAAVAENNDASPAGDEEEGVMDSDKTHTRCRFVHAIITSQYFWRLRCVTTVAAASSQCPLRLGWLVLARGSV